MSANIQLSQGLEVISPRSDLAYPIPREEWNALKSKVSRVTSEPWLFHTLGSLLLGASLSTLSSILLGAYDGPNQERAGLVAWGVVVVCGFCGAVSLLFAHKERGVIRERATDIIAQMDLIDSRFERKPTNTESGS